MALPARLLSSQQRPLYMCMCRPCFLVVILSLLELGFSSINSSSSSCDLIRKINVDCLDFKQGKFEFCNHCRSTMGEEDTSTHAMAKAAAKVKLPSFWNIRDTFGDCSSSEFETSSVRLPKKQERIPFHTHVHKTGGTLMCQLAILQPKSTITNKKLTLARGCNMLGDGPNTILGDKLRFPPVNTASGIFGNRDWCCAARYQKALERQKGLIEREIFFPQTICLDLFIYSIFLRDPISRILSHIKFHQLHPFDPIWLNETIFAATASSASVVVDRNGTKKKKSSKNPQQDVSWPFLYGSAPYNNYNIRILGGEVTFFTPIEALNEQHLKAAMSIIDLHEIVILLEHFDEQKIQLEKTLGWNFSDSMVDKYKRATKDNKNAMQLSNDQLELLKLRNALDVELYKHAAVRSWNLTREVVPSSSSS
jgi:hypothetical protein